MAPSITQLALKIRDNLLFSSTNFSAPNYNKELKTLQSPFQAHIPFMLHFALFPLALTVMVSKITTAITAFILRVGKPSSSSSRELALPFN